MHEWKGNDLGTLVRLVLFTGATASLIRTWNEIALAVFGDLNSFAVDDEQKLAQPLQRPFAVTGESPILSFGVPG